MMIFLWFIFIIFGLVRGDTPANCTYEDIRGDWKFFEGPRGNAKDLECSSFTNPIDVYQIRLDFPDIATDDEGNVGFWTLIYNQGFEVVINGRKYFAFSYYKQNKDNVTSFCKTTFPGSSHKIGVNPSDWSCFYGLKDTKNDQAPFAKVKKTANIISAIDHYLDTTLYEENPGFINKINEKQSSWKATHYNFMSKMNINELIRMAGGKKSKGFSKPKPAKVTPEVITEASALPDSFDWRNASGVNYVSPIRNQGSCGSCYTFGSMAMHEARLRIKTNNKLKTVFSTQDIVECSEYSQGCDGGFPYLIAGKYAEDFGIVEESCNPYKGTDGKCHTDPKCKRVYGTNYKYIGGFYGACNEELMKISLVNNGPIAVSFQVYDDFLSYRGGIYHHTGIKDSLNFGFNPWEITNHVVAIVGYGADSKTGEKYWIVKNSWGTSWGEDGFFRIRRGTDECSIESIAVEADILP